MEGTALRIWPPDAPWTSLGVSVVMGDKRSDAAEFALFRCDPMMVAVPINPSSIPLSLTNRIYEVASDPSLFG